MTISNGSLTDADEVLRITKIDQVYTGTGFNGGSHELTAVSSTDLVNANYVIVTIYGTAVSSTGGGSTGNDVTLQVELKETGGSYGDISATHIINSYDGAVSSISTVSSTTTTIGTLTAGMRTNGFQVRITGSGYVNRQTILGVRP